ncbi:MAG: anti-sigma factor, partial [Bdellovibrionota bacterium]
MALGPEITCFEWRAHASDFLDGLLPEKTKRDADDHLVGCPACREQLKHFRAILAALSAQPRSALPIGIRKAPLGFRIPKPDANLKISRWERAPWYVRTAIEGFGVGLLILAIITVIPKARELYEKSTQRKIEAIGFDDPELGMKGEGAETLQLARGRSDPGNGGGGPGATGLENSEGDIDSGEYAEDDLDLEDAPEAETDEGEVTVGKGEIWRFSFKTDSPAELRPRIIQYMKDLRVPADTLGFGGVEAPGGIQFDLLVPRNVIGSLRAQLQKMAKISEKVSGKNAGKAQGVPQSTDFTWYKTRSAKPIPEGKA